LFKKKELLLKTYKKDKSKKFGGQEITSKRLKVVGPPLQKGPLTQSRVRRMKGKKSRRKKKENGHCPENRRLILAGTTDDPIGPKKTW